MEAYRSVEQGTQSEINKLVSGLGSNRLDISSGAGNQGGIRSGAGSQWTVPNDEAVAIRTQIPKVQYLAAGIRGGCQWVYAENNWSTSWQGVQPDFFDINSWKLAQGDGLQAQDYSGASKSVVIGETIRSPWCARLAPACSSDFIRQEKRHNLIRSKHCDIRDK